MTEDFDTPDPSDLYDTDLQDWIDDRSRLLTDGCTVTPATIDDLRAEKAAAMAANDWALIHSPTGWRHDGRRIA